MTTGENKVLFMSSYFGITENRKNSHPIAIFNNYNFWWKRQNKTRYASINFKDDSVIKVSGKYLHDKLTDVEIKLLTAKQELKVSDSTELSKSTAFHYKEMESKLIMLDIPARVIAAKMPSFKQMSSGLQKIRQKLIPTIPSDFSKLDISGDYALTTNKKEFLRYDNKSNSNRIIIFVDDQSLEILCHSDQLFMDGTFKSAPKQPMQLFTIHALVKFGSNSSTYPCVLCQFVHYSYEYWFDERDLSLYLSEELDTEDGNIDGDESFRLEEFVETVDSNDQSASVVSNQSENMEQNTFINLETVNFQDYQFSNQNVLHISNDNLQLEQNVIKRRVPLASIITSDPNFYDGLDSDSFNYSQATVNFSPLRRMREAKRQETDIDEEVRHELAKNGIDGSRTRISKNDRKEARTRLEKRINVEEEKNKHETFLKTYRDNPNY
ncbi:unnamed protein product [Brachionus calyciflorus]|uniref:Uncharacterized protein n=1 Tax=Brachionus calyciflorus TaxID=104777 RepID=A0A814B8H5_9BILA|nr:unnamed protein product [Brachionus calyciflorus]